MSVPYAISVPTFIGSICSCIASFFVLLCYAILPTQRHFRHALIINLLIADFINALNNSISGAAVLHARDHQILAGAACVANGWFNQLTVQTVDFSVIAISLAVLGTVTQARCMQNLGMRKGVMICVGVWMPGLVTGFIALGLNLFGPVSGNWCWIRSGHLLERYLLTHGWRILIFFTTIAIYTYIYIYLKRVFGSLNMTEDSSHDTNLNRSKPGVEELEMHRAEDMVPMVPGTPSSVTPVLDKSHTSDNVGLTNHPSSSKKSQTDIANRTAHQNAAISRRRELKRMLLLNGYPAMYIILWIPGIANRLTESIAGKSPVWLTALQASSQFVGVANALTYGYNEGLRRQIQEWWYLRRYGVSIDANRNV